MSTESGNEVEVQAAIAASVYNEWEQVKAHIIVCCKLLGCHLLLTVLIFLLAMKHVYVQFCTYREDQSTKSISTLLQEHFRRCHPISHDPDDVNRITLRCIHIWKDAVSRSTFDPNTNNLHNICWWGGCGQWGLGASFSLLCCRRWLRAAISFGRIYYSESEVNKSLSGYGNSTAWYSNVQHNIVNRQHDILNHCHVIPGHALIGQL